MFIFRVEHRRDICSHETYNTEGRSKTGHGTYTRCPNKFKTPNFGLAGNTPSIPMMVHERCAVTADQFYDWVGTDYSCKYSRKSCYGSDYCYDCPVIRGFELESFPNWELVSYWVEDLSRGFDWRNDCNQIVFNPEFAICMGAVTLEDVQQFQTSYA